MTDFLNVLEKVLEALEHQLVNAAKKTFTLTKGAVKDAIQGFKVAATDLKHTASTVASDAYEVIHSLAEKAYGDMIALRGIFMELMRAIEDTLRRGFQAVESISSKVESEVGKVVGDIGNAVVKLTQSADSVGHAVKVSIEEAVATIESVIGTIIRDASRVAGTVEHAVEASLSKVSSMLHVTISGISAGFEKVVSDVSMVVREAVDSLVAIVEKAVKTVEDAVDDAIRAGSKAARDVEIVADKSLTVVRNAASDVVDVAKKAVGTIESVPTTYAIIMLSLPSAICALVVGTLLIGLFYYTIRAMTTRAQNPPRKNRRLVEE